MNKSMKIDDIGRCLILLRHAHRDEANYNLDNGLSELGKRQAQASAAALHRALAGASPTFESSPKLRCQETLKVLADLFGQEQVVQNDLEEKRGDEDAKGFEARINKKLQDWMDSEAKTSVFCSHGDWIPIALKQLLDVSSTVKKAHWVQLELSDERGWVLREMTPSKLLPES